MTPTQIRQFNQMRAALIQISQGFQTPAQIKKTSRNLGTDGFEVIEKTYERIQLTAIQAVVGVKAIDPKAQEVAGK